MFLCVDVFIILTFKGSYFSQDRSLISQPILLNKWKIEIQFKNDFGDHPFTFTITMIWMNFFKKKSFRFYTTLC